MSGESSKPTLKEQVLEYQRTGRGLSDIIRSLAPVIYGFPRGRYGWREDDCGEFFLFFYPRLIRIVQKFKDQGKPFEWYLNSVLRWQLKSYRENRHRAEQVWNLSTRAELWDLPFELLPEEGEEREAPGPKLVEALGIGPFGRIENRTARKRFLFWALKHVRRLEGGQIERLASLTGFDRECLEGIVVELRRRLRSKEQRLARLRDRMNRSFYRSRLLEEELRMEVDPEKRACLLYRLQKLKRCIRLAQRQVERVPLCPTNRDIGEVLGVPKGTVDTSLYWLKNKLSFLYSLSTGEQKRYA